MGRTVEKRFVRHVCLRNPFLALLSGIPSIRSLPEASGSWEPQYALNCGCIMPMPSLQQKTCLTQRSRGFGHGVVVSKICYNAVIVLSVVLCDCCKPMNNCRDWAFSNSGLEVGLPGCQLEKCDSLPKRDLCGMLHDSAITFWSFKHPISARRRFLRAAVRSALWFYHAHPFVAVAGKRCVLCREAEGLVTELWSPRFVATQWLCSQLCCVTAANQWTIVEIELLATVGLEVRLPAFQLPVLEKCD